MNIKDYKHVHLIGAGGISVSAIAKLFLHHGVSVSGSDTVASDITRELESLGAQISIGSSSVSAKGGPASGWDLVIYSEAVPEDNAERAEAVRRGIKQMTGAEFWGEFSRAKKVVAVSGTNGKSTTTALVGAILIEAGFDPTVVVGTRVLQWNNNIIIGQSEWLVIEADEYRAKMLNYYPQVAVITNLAPDHLDFYKDLNDIVAHFQTWIEQIAPDGGLILNQADQPSLKLKPPANLQVKYFSLPPGDLALQANALAATAAAELLNIPTATISQALADFKGAWRRFETVGDYNRALIISDYAHHPDGIKATLQMAKQKYPERRLVLLYQPHQHNRTKNLFQEFVDSFDLADELILAEIYDVAGRTEAADQHVSSRDLVEAIKKRWKNEVPFAPHPSPLPKGEGTKERSSVFYAPDLQQAEAMLKSKIQPDDIVIVMGAGDVDSVARRLVQNK